MTDELEQLVADIQRVAASMGTTSLARSEYLQRGEFTSYQLYDDGRNWTELCSLAGLNPETVKAVSDETYFRRLANAVEELGRYPKTSERKRYGLNAKKTRFPTLRALIEKAIEAGFIEDLQNEGSAPEEPDSQGSENQVSLLIKSAMEATIPLDRPIPPIPLRTQRTKWRRISLSGFPYAPQEEQGVLAVFAILCAQRVLPWQIIDVSSGKGIDATCYDEVNRQEIQVELKYVLSRSSWNHPIEELDYVVYWEDRWPSFPKPVIELSTVLRDL